MVRDRSGAIRVEGAQLVDGDIVGVWGSLDPVSGAIFLADVVELLVRPTARQPRPVPCPETLVARAELLAGLRGYFVAEEFVEVETPNLVREPGTDVHLEAFQTHFSGMGEHEGRALWLHTSPEFAMKRLLVAGMERIFQICKVWRDGEWTSRHNPEFTMVEWYRAYSDWDAVMTDVEHIVATALDLPRPFRRLKVQEAFREYGGVDVLSMTGTEGWEDAFHEILVTEVEPRLTGAVFLTHYPKDLAVLSRLCDEDPAVAERFELYVDGVELCNGFTELTDAAEQRQRFQDDLGERERRGLGAMPMPEMFLNALSAGMPPSAGVALGFDRLLMLQLGSHDLDALLMR
jgi:lysyl-tRNA synthetase class 2